VADLSGIYAIEHLASGRLYIGSARRVMNRWSEHKCRLRKNAHHSPKLQRSWNKHGAGAFDLVLIEAVTKDELVTREQYWLDTLKPFFNIRPTANSPLGLPKSPESIEKTASKLRGRKRTAEQIANMKAGQAARDAMTPEELARWRKRLSESRRKWKHKPETIEKFRALKGYKHTEQARRNMSLAHIGQKPSPKAAARSAELFAKSYVVVSPAGERIEVVNMRAFCRERGLDPAGMNLVVNGKRPQHKGWRAFS
jgi:group I intron endonuclease